VVVPRCRDGPLLPKSDRLVGQVSDRQRTGSGCPSNGGEEQEPKKTLIHSDQGSQYGSDAWRRFCRSNHLEPSMSRRGNCWDNAVVESFFSSLKKERIKKRIYKTRDLATADIAAYIESFYNTTRRHGHIGGVSPNAFEAAVQPL